MLVRILLILLFCFSFGGEKENLPHREVGDITGNGNELQLKATLAMPDESISNAHGKACLLLQVTTDSLLLMDEEASKTPLNISLVLDRSDSMRGAKVENARSAARFVIDALENEDRISLIAYDSRVQVVSPSVQVGKKRHRKALQAKVDGIYCEGATNLSGGMLTGFSQVDSLFERDCVNRVLLLSDGLANKGIIDPFQLKDTVRQLNRTRGITLSTFGLGSDFDEDLMEGMADFGGGNYYFIQRESHLSETLLLELKRLQAVSGQEAMLTIVYPSRYMRLERSFAYEYVKVGEDTLHIPLNDFFAGETKTAMLCFDMPEPLPEGAGVHCHLNYRTAKGGDKRADYKWLNPSRKPTDEMEVRRAFVLFSANEKMREAIAETGKGNFEAAKKLASDNGDLLQFRFEKDTPADSLLQKLYDYNNEYLSHIDGYRAYSKYKKKMLQKDFKNRNYILRKGRLPAK